MCAKQVSRRRFLTGAAGAVAGGAALIAAPNVSRAQTVTLKMQGSWAPADVWNATCDCSSSPLRHAAAPIARRGISIVNAAPPSGQFLTVTRPPCTSAIRWTIAKPSPVPSLLVV